MLDLTPRSPIERAFRWVCTLLLGASIGVVAAQSFNSGNLIPEPGSVPAFPVEIDFILPESYQLDSIVDNSKWFPPPGDQGQQASCNTWALCYAAMSYWWNRADGRTYSPLDTADPATTYSPAYLFNILKQRSSPICTTGTGFSSVVSLAAEKGICTWQQMPYDKAANACQDPLPASALGGAVRSFRPQVVDIGKTDFRQWQYYLNEGRPIIIEISPDSTFRDGGYATHGDSMLYWHNNGDGTLLLGHTVVCTGYTGDSLFTCINSYGTHWGGHGYFTVTWDRLVHRCTDAHVLFNDTTGARDLLPVSFPEGDTLKGGIARKRIDQGQVLRTDLSLIRLASLAPAQRNAVVEVFRPAEKTLLHALHMRPGQTYAIYGDGKRTDYTYQRASLVGRWLKRSVRLTVTTTDARSDPYLAKRDALLRKLHVGMR